MKSKPRLDGKKKLITLTAQLEEYLGQYFTAMYSGIKFKVSLEEAEAFSQDFEKEINKIDRGHKDANPFNLFKICNKAEKLSSQCKA